MVFFHRRELSNQQDPTPQLNQYTAVPAEVRRILCRKQLAKREVFRAKTETA